MHSMCTKPIFTTPHTYAFKVKGARYLFSCPAYNTQIYANDKFAYPQLGKQLAMNTIKVVWCVILRVDYAVRSYIK